MFLRASQKTARAFVCLDKRFNVVTQLWLILAALREIIGSFCRGFLLQSIMKDSFYQFGVRFHQAFVPYHLHASIRVHFLQNKLQIYVPGLRSFSISRKSQAREKAHVRSTVL